MVDKCTRNIEYMYCPIRFSYVHVCVCVATNKCMPVSVHSTHIFRLYMTERTYNLNYKCYKTLIWSFLILGFAGRLFAHSGLSPLSQHFHYTVAISFLSNCLLYIYPFFSNSISLSLTPNWYCPIAVSGARLSLYLYTCVCMFYLFHRKSK